MVDLQSQHKKIHRELNSCIQKVVDSGAYINGPEVGRFADSLSLYLGSKYVIPCANGTDALQIALMSLDLKPGDEVITPTFTYVATAEVISLLGLKAVLVDVDPDYFGLNIEQVKTAITPRTRVIIPVHLFGQSANLEPLMNLAADHKINIIEDAAQSMGASYRFLNGNEEKLGTIGRIGCTSFLPTKNLGCLGDGGAIITNDDFLAERIKMVANHGEKIKYHHDIIGCNSRLDTIQAAILNLKLVHLDNYNKSRQQAAKFYDKHLASLKSIRIPMRRKESTHVFHQYTLRIINGKRDQMVKFLNENGVPCGIYYPVPLHNQNAYKSKRYIESDFSVTNQICSEVFSLPMHSELSEEQQNFISDLVNEFSLKS
jgi:dTDP-4-amino-4,6-dideoxygalactose transaminase